MSNRTPNYHKPSRSPKSLQTKIFYSIFGLVAGVEIVIFVLFFLVADKIGQKWAYEHLEQESQKLITQMHNTDYLAFWARYPYRISLITEEGIVVYDNTISAVDLGNHKNREEVQMALTIGKGYIEYKSANTRYNTLYYARYLPEYKLILRISMDQKDLYALLLPILGYMAILLAVTLLLSTIITSYLTKSIIAPLNNLSTLDTKKFRVPYRELVPFFERLIAQKKQLKKQLKIIQQQQQQFQAISQNIDEGLVLIDTNKQILSYNTKAKDLLPSLESSHISANVNTIKQPTSYDVFAFIDYASLQIQTSELQIQDNHIECIALPIWGKLKPKAFVILLLDRNEKNQIHAMRKEFSANVTHELKTPLSVIMASSEMMKKGLIPQKDFMLFFDKIYDECKRLLGIINDVLKLSFFDEGNVELETSVIDIQEVAHRVLQSLSSLITEKQLQVQMLYDETIEYATNGVLRLLEDMLYNLCENAIKYNTQQGLLEICLHCDMFCYQDFASFTHITSNLALPIGQKIVSIAIKDSGVGIPKDEQMRVFERFYRVDKSRSKKLGGTGLGLSIVKHIALYHHAHIFLRSQVDSSGGGSEIVVVFAAAQDLAH